MGFQPTVLLVFVLFTIITLLVRWVLNFKTYWDVMLQDGFRTDYICSYILHKFDSAWHFQNNKTPHTKFLSELRKDHQWAVSVWTPYYCSPCHHEKYVLKLRTQRTKEVIIVKHVQKTNTTTVGWKHMSFHTMGELLTNSLHDELRYGCQTDWSCCHILHNLRR